MDLKSALLQEHSKTQALKIAKYIGSSQKRYDALMELFLTEEYRVTQRAAWPLLFATEKNPHLLQPHLRSVIENLNNPTHDAVKRNTLRFLQFVELPEDLLGITAEICFAFLGDPKEAIAIRVFSMTVLYNICVVEPELSNELRLVIEEFLPHGSAGFKSRGKRVLKDLSVLEKSGKR